jgi:hypothetical protein
MDGITLQPGATIKLKFVEPAAAMTTKQVIKA